MPIPVRTKPKFRCQFCSYTATEPTVLKHERICWKNPDRTCDLCQDTGMIDNIDCYYCAQRKCWKCQALVSNGHNEWCPDLGNERISDIIMNLQAIEKKLR